MLKPESFGSINEQPPVELTREEYNTLMNGAGEEVAKLMQEKGIFFDSDKGSTNELRVIVDGEEKTVSFDEEGFDDAAREDNREDDEDTETLAKAA